MKKKILLSLVLVASFLGCEDSKEDEFNSEALKERASQEIFSGEYSGTFTRGDRSETLNLYFDGDKYVGNSSAFRFPAICMGVFTHDDKTIDFSDGCVWTADFDWTLILNGSWEYTYENGILRLVNEMGDLYILQRK